jgi:hypothetical protein
MGKNELKRNKLKTALKYTQSRMEAEHYCNVVGNLNIEKKEYYADECYA